MLATIGLSLILAAAIPEPAEPSPIIVQGVRDRDKKIGDFIKELTPAPSGGQLGRFELKVCPAVVGLSDLQNAAVAGRMRRVAEAAGLKLARPKCDPNVILIITSDKSALVKRLAKERGDYFPSVHNSYDFKSLEDAAKPVAAWQIKDIRGADGKDLQQDMSGAMAGVAGAYARKTIEAGSRTKPAVRPHFVASIVVVQANALAGLTTTQLADYAAMRAFVRTDPAKLRTATSDTILSAIDAPMGTPVPLTLTAWDLSFLKAYYSSGLNSYAGSQRSEMRRSMKRDMERDSKRSE
jgi:hypothetical protein